MVYLCLYVCLLMSVHVAHTVWLDPSPELLFLLLLLSLQLAEVLLLQLPFLLLKVPLHLLLQLLLNPGLNLRQTGSRHRL